MPSSSGKNLPARRWLLFALGTILSAAMLPAAAAQVKHKPAPTKSAAPVAKPVTRELQKLSFETAEVDAAGKLVNRQRAETEYYSEDLGKGIKLEMVKIPGGSFLMGSDQAQSDQFKKEIERYCPRCNADKTAAEELPQHRVTIAPFYLGKIEITQAQWKAFMRINPSNFKNDELPAENMSWHDAVKFCQMLSLKTGIEYRLPTEAEWEYACRAGSNKQFSFGDTINAEIVNYDSSAPFGNAPKAEYRETTLPGGKLGMANAFGLYDMHGNVYEWCADTWHENYQGAPTDGSAWTKGGVGFKRVLRGGAWDVNAYNCRAAYRIADFPDKRGIGPSLGFRVAAVLPTSSTGDDKK
jgi:formylglycine-generating enzyme required for sulfatase activity